MYAIRSYYEAISLIAIHSHDIPSEFSPHALAEAEAARPVSYNFV